MGLDWRKDAMGIDLEGELRRQTGPSAPELCRSLPDGVVQCLACAHRCKIQDGKRGVCRVRYVEAGVLRRPRGYVMGLNLDPIEKKPFFHVFPGRGALTFGMLGCDFHCSYCQNWETSQALRFDGAGMSVTPISPEEITRIATRASAPVIVSSYNEPLITADWAVEVFRPAIDRGITCGFVSNGNATAEVLDFLLPYVKIYKVDLKAFRDITYRDLGGRLSVVLETLKGLKARGIWVEVVTLLVPGLNDDPGELKALVTFLAELDRDIPWHVTAFHPDYKMLDRPRTGPHRLVEAYDIARTAGLRFVYVGNVGGEADGRESTYCPGCGDTVIQRRGFQVLLNRIVDGSCPRCRTVIPGLWEPSR
jgi:pyruvate formate lyase activating enzyme